MATVYIVRHGNTFDAEDTILRVGGPTDLPLSSSGQAQATALGDALSKIRFDRAIVSPLKRTLMTANAILSKQAAPLKPELTRHLIEVDYGPDEGQPEDTVIARVGQDALRAWETDATVPPGWKVDPFALRQVWREILAEASKTELIVTSNGVARFVLDVAQHQGVERKLKTGAYGILDGSGENWHVTAWNIRP